MSGIRGGFRGGGVLGALPSLPFEILGTPKLHKEGKNVARVCAETPRFSKYQLPGSPPFRNPVAAPGHRTFHYSMKLDSMIGGNVEAIKEMSRKEQEINQYFPQFS